MEKGLDMAQLGQFMNRTFTGKVNMEKVKAIRDIWKGPLVLKGIATEEDMEASIQLGVDGVIVSNHGGRQVDAGESSIVSLIKLASNPSYKNKLKIMMDGGIRSGVDLARAHAVGSEFNFMGRPFMYGVGALGEEGGEHTINMFKAHLYQVMQQLTVDNIHQLQDRLIK
jgi:L-lactate dehydrogenase (cytochrome)